MDGFVTRSGSGVSVDGADGADGADGKDDAQFIVSISISKNFVTHCFLNIVPYLP